MASGRSVQVGFSGFDAGFRLQRLSHHKVVISSLSTNVKAKARKSSDFKTRSVADIMVPEETAAFERLIHYSMANYILLPPSSSPPVHHSPKNRIRQPNRHRLILRIIRQRRLAQLASNARLLVPTKWQLPMQHIVLVHPHRARLERICHPNGLVEVLRVYARGKAVCGRVAGLDDFLLGLKLLDRADRAEDLFFDDGHVITDAGEDGRLNEVALLAMALAADFDLGAGFFALVDVASKKTHVSLCVSQA